MNTVVVVQARTGSTRLPGKVLLPLGERPMLAVMLERIAAATEPFKLVVATTTDSADNIIAALCRRLGVDCYRGHPTDLLTRHYFAAIIRGADTVVKIPSDCPLIDARVIDRVLGYYRDNAHRFDFVSNLHPATYPDGNDVEVMSFRALQTAYFEARSPIEREHTTPFIWGQPERFRIGNVPWETGLDYSLSHRWVVDYRPDYELVRTVYEALRPVYGPLFSLKDILALVREQPAIRAINAEYRGISWYTFYHQALHAMNLHS
jgi:spore coat polysaccharide biosynthesis protein SpsF